MSGYNFDTPDGQRLLKELRQRCARLPAVEEITDGFGHRTFKVSGKSFVIAGMGVDGGSISIKADHESQAMLIRRGPWYRTPYIGQHGWVTLDAPLTHDWSEVEELIEDGYRLAAPKRLVKELDAAT
jgi:predicted DNA-binding protein (MmcQ/YjbR family)